MIDYPLKQKYIVIECSILNVSFVKLLSHVLQMFYIIIVFFVCLFYQILIGALTFFKNLDVIDV